MIRIAILGHGVVGSGVAEVLRRNKDTITHKAGESIEIGRILDLRTFPELPYADLFTTSFDEILNDESIRIVVETMGGLHPAYEFVKSCLLAGKSVVTSNKELVAAFGHELLAVAAEKNVNFMFEASVGGGIPILRPLDQCLAANEVCEIAGILNGTTNFMLTRMVNDGADFDSALAEAQALGYAERNPAADVEGHDACRKICILASLAFGKHVFPEQVATEGITKLTPADVRSADALGCVIKLIGRVRQQNEHLYCQVAPMLIPRTSLLADVNDVFNGILVRGNAIGDVVFYGRGAGALPTASAVVADVIDEARHLESRKPLSWGAAEEGYVLNAKEDSYEWLLRFECNDTRSLLNRLCDVLGEITPVTYAGAPSDEVAVRVPHISEAELEEKLAAVSDVAPVSRLRIAPL